jgi:hypothetical protein
VVAAADGQLFTVWMEPLPEVHVWELPPVEE